MGIKFGAALKAGGLSTSAGQQMQVRDFGGGQVEVLISDGGPMAHAAEEVKDLFNCQA